jgi:hypothetical protein
MPLNDPLEIDENIYKLNCDINKYNNKLIYIPFFEEDGINQIESNIGIINNTDDPRNFLINYCQINNKKSRIGLPIFLVNNLKIVGLFYSDNENTNKGMYYNMIMKIYNEDKKYYYIYCFLNLRPKTTKNNNSLNILHREFPDHNKNIYAVETNGKKIQASIESIKFKNNGAIYQFKKKQILEDYELDFKQYNVGKFDRLFVEIKIDNKIQKYGYFMSTCPDNICPSIKKNTILKNMEMKLGNKKYKLRALETKIITPSGTKIKTELCQID